MNYIKQKWITPVFLLAGLTVFTACKKEEREQLKAEADMLEQKLQERDSAYNAIMNVMVELEGQIEEIKARENLITNASGEVEPRSKEQLVADIRRINELIDNTNQKVQSLSGNLENSQLELRAFKNRVQKMTTDLQERENALTQLRKEVETKEQHIAELNTEVSSLSDKVQLQTETIDEQTQRLSDREYEINKAYFAVDNEEKLREAGLVVKEGGFLGIGRTMQIKPDVSKDKFNEVNIQETRRFYIDGKKMEIVTEHPSDSYKVVRDDEKIKYIEITDPANFWRISKYLVVSIDS